MLKRLFALLLLVLMCINYTGVLAYAAAATAQGPSYETLVPKKLEAEMKDAIVHIYGK